LGKEHEKAKGVWATPRFEKISAGDAEANGPNTNDGGPVGNARS
jgi:hypothetical protein